MLFPNAQVRMKLKDKLLMGGFAVGGGITVLLKAGAGLVAMASILWLMSRAVIVGRGEIPSLGPVEISGMVGGVSERYRGSRRRCWDMLFWLDPKRGWPRRPWTMPLRRGLKRLTTSPLISKSKMHWEN
jgi:hypothetical protein